MDTTPDTSSDRPVAVDPQAPPTVEALMKQFREFAADCTEDPLYERLCRLAAERPERAALLQAAPSTQARCVLWFAAIHDRLLEQAESGERAELAHWYPDLVDDGTAVRPLDDPALGAALDDFLQREQGPLRQRIATRSTQTNEVGRCAILAPLLADVAAAHGGRPLALLDVGSSAGLNLGVDRFHYRYLAGEPGRDEVVAEWRGADGASADPAAGRLPVIDCTLAGGRPRVAPVRIVAREGIDIAPIPLDDAVEIRWLRACLWPTAATRRERFDRALAVARQERWPSHRVDDVTSGLLDWLERLPADTVPVIFNSWVLAYFDRPSLGRHIRTLLHRVAEGRAVWISAEIPKVMRHAWPEIPEPTGEEIARAERAGVPARELAEATAWTVARALPGPSGEPSGALDWRLAARSHGHGRWAQFLPL